MISRLSLVGLALCACVVLHQSPARSADRPNVVLIVCDDLNDYIAGLNGHPQARTPNLEELAATGVSFRRAYSNNPVCAPSRSSFLTGIYPHTSGNLFWAKWYENPVLENSNCLMEHFKNNGYHVAGSGKLMHHHQRGVWSEFYQKADYGPFVYDGKDRVAHPSVPGPFSTIGAVDGSYAPLSDLPYGSNPQGKKGWIYGKWGKVKRMRYVSETDRDPTPDEINAKWAAKKIREFAANGTGKPFFLGVGFIRPHTPLHAPKRFFDMFPLESIKIPVIKPGDDSDCHYKDVFDMKQKGLKYFQLLKQSYPNTEDGLRAYVQAYLACVAAVDDCVGQVVSEIDRSPFRDNTVIVVTSDHGYNLGEKDYLFKNSLWEESARVPLIIRAPGIGARGEVVDNPVSLIDIYPTLVDLCGLPRDTRKNAKGAKLDGFSLRPLLENPRAGRWSGPDAALTMVFAGPGTAKDHTKQHWSVRTKRWRYILYNNGAEELYDHDVDPYEWTNLAKASEHDATRRRLRAMLMKMTKQDR